MNLSDSYLYFSWNLKTYSNSAQEKKLYVFHIKRSKQISSAFLLPLFHATVSAYLDKFSIISNLEKNKVFTDRETSKKNTTVNLDISLLFQITLNYHNLLSFSHFTSLSLPSCPNQGNTKDAFCLCRVQLSIDSTHNTSSEHHVSRTREDLITPACINIIFARCSRPLGSVLIPVEWRRAQYRQANRYLHVQK